MKRNYTGTLSSNVEVIRVARIVRACVKPAAPLISAYNNRSGSYFSSALFILVFQQDTFPIGRGGYLYLRVNAPVWRHVSAQANVRRDYN